MLGRADEAVRPKRGVARAITYRLAAGMRSIRSRPAADDGRARCAPDAACVCFEPAAPHLASGGRVKVHVAKALRGSAIGAPRRARDAVCSGGPRAYHGKERHRHVLHTSGRSCRLVVECGLELGISRLCDSVQLFVVSTALLGVGEYGIGFVNHADHLFVRVPVQTLLDRLVGGFDPRRRCAGGQIQEVVVGVVHDTILVTLAVWEHPTQHPCHGFPEPSAGHLTVGFDSDFKGWDVPKPGAAENAAERAPGANRGAVLGHSCPTESRAM